MKATISRLLSRVKRLGIGQPQEFTNIFAGLMSGQQGCSYWTQERLCEYAATHPEDGRTNGMRVITVGCPKIPETDWCRLGSQKYDSDGSPLPAPERPCTGCEFLIPALERDIQGN